jgi:hypothetical protein
MCGLLGILGHLCRRQIGLAASVNEEYTYIMNQCGHIRVCSEKFGFAFQIDALPFGQLVEFNWRHLEDVLKVGGT